MTENRANVRRILLAVTETSSLPDLWHAVTEHLGGEETELVTIFFSDDRWRRAASLPFTREIHRLGGGSADFTLTRAEQLGKDDIAGIQRRLAQFATEAKIRFAFEVSAGQEAVRIQEWLTSQSDVLIAPSSFKGRPIYNEIVRLKCRIRFVEPADASAQPRHQKQLKRQLAY